MTMKASLADEMHKHGGELLWHTTIPVDQDRLWDTRGSYFFFRILQRNQRLCNEFLNSREYQEFLRTTKVDLVVVDHFIQVWIWTGGPDEGCLSFTLQFTFRSALPLPPPS